VRAAAPRRPVSRCAAARPKRGGGADDEPGASFGSKLQTSKQQGARDSEVIDVS
jgi:hypothetical protein